MQINQFHSGTAVGDAITNQMLMIRELLIKNGYSSEIYAEYVADGLKHIIKPISEYKGTKDGILFVHHSMGMNVFDQIINLPDKKVLVYHNITPERFFDDAYIIKYVRLGLEQAKAYKDHVDYFVADSNYNRRELIAMGHDSNIDILPVQVSLDRFDTVDATPEILENNKDTKNIIFVGRVVWNKRQDDIIKSFAVYNRYYNPQSKLFIIGDNSMKGYVEDLKSLLKRYDIEDKVVLTGKVSEEDLKAYYSIADLFLCMSEHEGFGVPLLEAMRMGVPVLAYRSSAIPETMDKAGVLVNEKNYAYIGALIHEILTDKDLNWGIVEKQKQRIKRLENTDTEKTLLDIISKVQSGKRKRTIQMQGPFETSYSLAIVNRKLIEELDDMGQSDVSIYCTEGPGDYDPKPQDLLDKPHAEKLWRKSPNMPYPDVTIRNMYPPRVHDANGGLNFSAFGWEESIIPEEYIKNFNTYLDGVGTMSDYVTEKLIECGLTIPVKTMGIGVELVPGFETLKPYKLHTKKSIKFLHISSAFPRKGVDVLLEGFYKTFTGDDDVCLVLKTFPNPHNNVAELLEDLNKRYSNPPQIEWINKDLSTEELNSLYKAADCYVQTARGEGFGLPVTEAMLAKVPVIVSPNSGMADFCNKDTALLVDYTLEPAKTHLTTRKGNSVSMWAEPKVDSLCKQLKYFVENRDSDEIKRLVKNAHALIAGEFSWRRVAERWTDFIHEVEADKHKPKVAMVTTWNNKCGIAEYTRMEVEATGKAVDFEIYPNYGVELLTKDEPNVHKRVWHSAFEGNMDVLVEELLNSGNEIIHFQFNFGFFNLAQFGDALEKLSKEKKVVITFHKTDKADVLGKIVCLESIKDQLNQCHALVVHQEKDVQNLVDYGIRKELIHLIRHGQITYPLVSTEFAKNQAGIQSSLVIGSYGFLLPHKGIKETIYAVAELKKKYPDVLYIPTCALHENPISSNYYKECLEAVEELGLEKNVRFVTDFLPNDESMRYMQCCDILVMPYKPTTESASGAVRFCLAPQRPLITTTQPIFDEFKDCAYQIPECDPKLIAQAVDQVWTSDKKEEYVRKIGLKMKETRWYTIADAFRKLYNNL